MGKPRPLPRLTFDIRANSVLKSKSTADLENGGVHHLGVLHTYVVAGRMISSTNTDSQGVVKVVLGQVHLFGEWYQECLTAHRNNWVNTTDSKKDSCLLGEITTFFKYNGPQSCTFFGNESLSFTRLQEMNAKPLACQHYTADTCYEFHQLLILAICNYFTALQIFKKAADRVIKTACNTQNAPNLKPLAHLIAPAKLLQSHLHLLWSIVQSRTFKWHLQLLCTEGRLQRSSRDLAGIISFAPNSTSVLTPHPPPQPDASCGELGSIAE